jgi:hypothetical protein
MSFHRECSLMFPLRARSSTTTGSSPAGDRGMAVGWYRSRSSLTLALRDQHLRLHRIVRCVDHGRSGFQYSTDGRPRSTRARARSSATSAAFAAT